MTSHQQQILNDLADRVKSNEWERRVCDLLHARLERSTMQERFVLLRAVEELVR
jgi:hypothetical protein